MSLGDERENRDLDRLLAELSLEKVSILVKAENPKLNQMVKKIFLLSTPSFQLK